MNYLFTFPFVSAASKDPNYVDVALSLTEKHLRPQLRPKAYHFLMDLIIDRDEGMMAIYRNFHGDPTRCVKEVKRYIYRKHLDHNAIKHFPPNFFAIDEEEEHRIAEASSSQSAAVSTPPES
eukprot:TRINITY_DN5288_c0_g1_i4.p1 TRINITY_DN5288_c0_g1~~TRINITY_DN5288_c0_g1_i4.p1  ORF type:complete len:140 (+),score=31.83 TRINITY_DN5288_c0_g1_i4:55-420(+)